MNERPLSLNAVMSLAAILGHKTETRRPVVIARNVLHDLEKRCRAIGAREAMEEFGYYRPGVRGNYGPPGTGLWLREPGRVGECLDDGHGYEISIQYLADKAWRTMPFPKRMLTPALPPWAYYCHGIPNGIFREAARYKSEVLEVRLELLQDITEEGARAEGAIDWWCGLSPDEQAKHFCGCSVSLDSDKEGPDPRDAFAMLWDSIYGKRPGLSWNCSPWVFVTGFKPMEPAA